MLQDDENWVSSTGWMDESYVTHTTSFGYVLWTPMLQYVRVSKISKPRYKVRTLLHSNTPQVSYLVMKRSRRAGIVSIIWARPPSPLHLSPPAWSLSTYYTIVRISLIASFWILVGCCRNEQWFCPSNGHGNVSTGKSMSTRTEQKSETLRDVQSYALHKETHTVFNNWIKII